MNQEAWNTKRKLWHISGCLSMIPVYFWWRGITYPLHYLNFLLCLSWFLAGICLSIDLLRLGVPSENQAFKRLPFYGSILRQHEHSGYNASTYCFVAVALLITGLYCGLVSEPILIASILVMAIADPLAALARFKISRLSPAAARLSGLIAFATGAIILANIVFHFSGGAHSWGIIIASYITATVEAYTAHFWKYLQPLVAKINLHLPKFVTVFYPDDNLTTPLVFAYILWLFSS